MFILFYFGTTSCWILVNIDFRPSQTMQAIGSSSLHFQFPLIFFWDFSQRSPSGVKTLWSQTPLNTQMLQ